MWKTRPALLIFQRAARSHINRQAQVPDFDWKADGGIVAAGIAILGLARRVFAPYATKQFADILQPQFREIANQHGMIRDEQERVRHELAQFKDGTTAEIAAMSERVASLEGALATTGMPDRRRKPR